MSQYVFDINRAPGISNPAGGETGLTLITGLNDNFTELYSSGGLGYTIQASDVISASAWWTADTVYVIKSDYDFGGATVVLPAGVVLFFDGGVWTNGTIQGTLSSFMTNGNIQAFTTSLTLSGTWKNDVLTPQMYGAITNANTGLTTNDCTAIFNKVLNSGKNVYIPNGLYYIATSIIITVPASIQCSGIDVDYSNAVISTTNHVRIYTNQNVSLLVLRSGNVSWLGGIFDVIQAANYTEDVVKYDCDYSSLNTRIDTSIFGSSSKLIVAGYNPIGVHFAQEDATVDYKEIHTATLKLRCYYLGIGVYVSDVVGGFHTLMSECDIDGVYWGCKRNVVINNGSANYIRGWAEGMAVNTLAESVLSAVYIGCTTSIIDFELYDYGTHDSPPLYCNQIEIENDNILNNFVGRCIEVDFLGKIQYNYPALSYARYRDLPFQAKAIKSYSNETVSKTDNEWAWLLKKIPTTTVVAYDGDGYDFDANLTPSVGRPAATSLTVTNAVVGVGLFEGRNTPPSITFGIEAKRETDFLEVVVPWTYSMLTFYISLFEILSLKFKYIQVIIHHVDGSDDSYKISGEQYTNGGDNIYFPISPLAVNGATQTMTRMIIRFIGGTNTTGIIKINEIHARSAYNTTSPMIDIGGGQTIYGNLFLQPGTTAYKAQITQNNTTANRPTSPVNGEMFFDTTLGVPIWYDGSNWIDAIGNVV
jgi:hypothetical protein